MQLFGHKLYKQKIEFGSNLDQEKNLAPPRQWAYDNIVYDYNRIGFRCPDFKQIDWENSIVVLGCSCTVGIGLAEQHTVTSQIEKLTGVPTINLGVSGSAIDHACWNSFILLNRFPKPKAVVHLWTQIDRYSDITKNGVRTYNVHNDFYRAEYEWQERNAFYVKTDRELWRGKTNYFEATFYKLTALKVKVPGIEMVDEAEDSMHPGKKTMKLMAEYVARGLGYG